MIMSGEIKLISLFVTEFTGYELMTPHLGETESILESAKVRDFYSHNPQHKRCS